MADVIIVQFTGADEQAMNGVDCAGLELAGASYRDRVLYRGRVLIIVPVEAFLRICCHALLFCCRPCRSSHCDRLLSIDICDRCVHGRVFIIFLSGLGCWIVSFLTAAMSRYLIVLHGLPRGFEGVGEACC